MIPLILYGSTESERAAELARLYPAAKFVYTHIKAAKSSILIAQIHELLTQLAVTTGMTRVIWIEEADLLTIPAQNALLKILEEPPGNTQFVLTLANPQNLLTTVRSRCKLISLSQNATKPDLENLSMLKKALSLSSGDRINIADSLGRKREELLIWLDSSLQAIESKLQTEKSVKSLQILSTLGTLLHQARVDLQANVSPSLVIQNLFLELPRSSSQA